VTATSDTKIYDGTTSSGGTPTITAGSLATGDSPNFTQVFDSPHVDATKVRPSGTANDGNSGKNYAYTFNDAAGTITPRPTTTVTADPQSKIYGEPDPTLTYQAVNNPPASYPLVAGDSFSGDLTRDAGEDAGTYAIRQGTLSLSTNYTLTFKDAKLTINQKTVTAAVRAASKVYDGTTAAT